MFQVGLLLYMHTGSKLWHAFCLPAAKLLPACNAYACIYACSYSRKDIEVWICSDPFPGSQAMLLDTSL